MGHPGAGSRIPGHSELLAEEGSGGYGYLGHESWVLGVWIVGFAPVLDLAAGFDFPTSARP
jgi:hypothetical protein